MNNILFKKNYSSGLFSLKGYLPLLLLLSSLGAIGQAPVVSAPTVSGVSTTTATLGGTVTGTLTHRGTRWHTSSPVGTNNQLEEASTTAEPFTQPRTGLPAATKIFFLAYARNGAPEGISTEASFFTEPTQLTGGQLTATATGSTAINLTFPSADSWEGSGATGGYVVYRKAGSAPTVAGVTNGAAPPVDGTGDKIATITDGTLTLLNNSTGLSAATDYYYTLVPFVWDGADDATYTYNTTSPQTANDFAFATEPGTHATGSITATAVSSSQINLSFNSVTTSAIANAAGYIVLVKSSAIIAADLATLNDGEAPNAFGLFEAIINSTGGNTYNDISGLTANTTYHYAIIPFNRGSDDQTYNYLTTTGFATGSATTLDIAATFVPIPAGTAPVVASAVLSAGVDDQVLTGFSVTSEGTQVINSIGFSYLGLTTQFTTEYLYRSTTPGSLGSLLITNNSPDGNFDLTGLGAGDKTINSTPVYYYLVVDVINSATTSTPNVRVTPDQTDIVVATGLVNTFSIFRLFTFNTSQLSDITFANDGTTPLINYRNFQGTSIGPGNAGSQSLGDFIIRDGGGANDPDNSPTSVTSITIQLTNFANVRQIALFDDDANSEIAGTEQTVTGNTVTFTPSTPIVVADNDDFRINVRASFQAAVTDKETIQISVTGATTSPTGSRFANPDAGGAVTSPAGTNAIAVVATKLVFTANPPATAINQPFALTIRAVDSNPNNNIDLDYTGQVALTKSPASGTLTAGAQSLTPNLIAGQFAWTDLRISAANNYTLEASDDAFADAIGDASGSVTISSSASNITQPTDPLLCYGGPTSAKVLGNIVITETDPAGFSGSAGPYTFSLALPSGFSFDQSVTTGLGVSGGSDLSAPSAYSYPATNIVEFSFTLNGTSNTNTITIGGLRVLHVHPGTVSPPATAVLTITRLGGTANLAGVSPGTVLGSISASQTNPPVTFTVAAVAGGVAIDPNTTNFNANSAAVNLVGSATPGIFTGSGVTFSNPNYRFNPSSLTPGSYDVTYTQTSAGTGCQSVGIKTFVIFTAGINGLNSTYCNNDPATAPLTVDQTFINQRFGGTDWRFDNFVYYDPNVFNFVKINSPSNNIFDPSLPQYQSVVQYFGGQIPVGFAVCSVNALDGVPCGTGNSTFGVFSTYQWVNINQAPSVNFTLPENLYAYCEDVAPIQLTGLPENSNDFLVDKFEASGGQSSSISHSIIAGKEQWFFSPAAVTGVNASTSQTFNVTYEYQSPTTGCSNSFTRSVTVHDRPTAVPASDITKSTSNPPTPSTTIQLCEGSSVGAFSATDATYAYRWYANPINPTSFSTGSTFTPVIDNLSAGTNIFNVTRSRNGCESINTPLALTVNVIATPAPPAVNRNLDYCIGESIGTNDLLITTATGIVKWYLAGNPTAIFTGANPTVANLGINTTTPNIYNFELTQTEATGCEGPLLADRTKIRVEIKPLPNITITPDIADINKICTTGGIVSFKATDQGNVAPNGTWSGIGLGGSGVLNTFNSEGRTELNPFTLSPQVFTLEYEYEDAITECSNSQTINFTILPTISPSISIGNVCDGSPAIFVNNSQLVNPLSSPTTIAFTEWTLGDGSVIASGPSQSAIPATTNNGRTTGTYFSPQHIYPNVGTFQISGAMITSDGCRYTFPVPPANIPVTVSPLPVINFTWNNVCRDGLSNTVFLATELSDPQIPINTYDWDFNVTNSLTFASAGSGNNPTVAYSSDGNDSVQLIVTTAAGCQDLIKKPVYIVPKVPAITSTSAYNQDFNTNADSWLTGGVNSSWVWGPLSVKGNENTSTRGNGWDTNDIPGGRNFNNPNEQSWVLSKCFNFTDAERPVIALDIYSETPFGVNGAVLQFNTDGNIENDASWVTLGDVGQGINWYDATGISSKPGNQTANDIGWTGNAISTSSKYNTWVRAIHRLDITSINKVDNVVFRIAFAGGNTLSDGFAFDNVFVGERTRNVLLENFTNSSSNVSAHNTAYKGAGNPSEIVKVQYHTPFPGDDDINKLSPQMHNARTAFYGITEAPTARLDGFVRGENDDELEDWLPDFYDDRVLTPSDLKITITTTKVNEIVEIVTSVENVSGQLARIGGAHLFTTIVEKNITAASLLGSSGNTEFVFVAKEMLPSPTGLVIPNDLGPGQIYTSPKIIWGLRNGDAIVASVQSIEGNNKVVHQAQIDLTPPQPDIVTGIEEWITSEVIEIYPNPANESFVIELPSKTETRLSVNLIDPVGRPIQELFFEKGEQRKTVNTQELAGGIYVVQIGAGKSGAIRKKVMVVHKN